jgi:hypothetical protein
MTPCKWSGSIPETDSYSRTAKVASLEAAKAGKKSIRIIKENQINRRL